MSVLIVGAGIGGLATAVGLTRIGHPVRVLERAESLGEVGAGLSLWPNALRALDALGVGEAVRAIGIPAVSRGGLRRASGRWIRHRHPDDVAVLMVHRAGLHRALLAALPADCVRAGSTVTAVEPDEAGALINYRAGGLDHREHADLVVAADGVHSVLRRQLWPAAAPARFDGRTAWRGVVAGELTADDQALTLERDRQFGILPLPGGQIYWFLTADADRPGRRAADELAEVRRRVEGWHRPISELLAATPASAVLHHDLTTLPPLPTYVRGRVALLGDAAHAQSPDLGQGACQALEDAVVLTASVAAEPDPVTALRRYDSERRLRSQAIAAAAQAHARLSHRHFGLMVTAARLLPPPLWRRQSSRWLDWTPPDLPLAPAARLPRSSS